MVLKRSDPAELATPALKRKRKRRSLCVRGTEWPAEPSDGALPGRDCGCPQRSVAPAAAHRGDAQRAPFLSKRSCLRFPGSAFKQPNRHRDDRCKAAERPLRPAERTSLRPYGPSASPERAPAALPSSPRAGGSAGTRHPCLPPRPRFGRQPSWLFSASQGRTEYDRAETKIVLLI